MATGKTTATVASKIPLPEAGGYFRSYFFRFFFSGYPVYQFTRYFQWLFFVKLHHVSELLVMYWNLKKKKILVSYTHTLCVIIKCTEIKKKNYWFLFLAIPHGCVIVFFRTICHVLQLKQKNYWFLFLTIPHGYVIVFFIEFYMSCTGIKKKKIF